MASPVVELLVLIFTFALRSITVFFKFLWNAFYTTAAAFCYVVCLVTIVRAKPDHSSWRSDAIERFAKLVFIDLPTLLPLLIVGGTLYRLPFLVKNIREDGRFHMPVWETAVIIIFLDLPTLVPGLIVLLSVYRIPVVYKKIKDDGNDEHYTIWRQAFFVLCDLMFAPFALVVVLTVYRLPRMIKKVREERVMIKKQGACVKEFLHILVDLPCIALGLVAACTWRLPFLIAALRDAKRNESVNDARAAPFQELGSLIVDIPVVILSPLLCSWRGVMLIRQWRHDFDELRLERQQTYWRHFFETDTGIASEVRGWAFQHEIRVFSDIFCAILLVILFFSWRNASARAIAAAAGQSDTRFYLRTIQSFCRLICLDFITILCSIIVAVTLVRLPQLIRGFKRAARVAPQVGAIVDACHRQRAILDEYFAWALFKAGSVIVDIFAGLCFVIICVTLWRVPPLRSKLKKLRLVREEKRAAYNREIEADLAAHVARDAGNEFNAHRYEDLEKPWSSAVWQRAAFVQVVWLLVDLLSMPAFFVVLLTLVRAPSLLSSLATGGDFYKQFAILSWIELGSLLVDIPFALLFLVLCVTRPVAAWVLLLEDRRHKRARMLKHHMQWLPSLIKSRRELKARLDDVESLYLKRRVLPLGLSPEYVAGPAALQTSMDETYGEIPPTDQFVPLFALSFRLFDYIAKLEDHRAVTEGLDPQYTYLIDSVLFQERLRARKAMRHYHVEYMYINNPDITSREQDLRLLNGEQAVYEEAVAGSYAALINYSPPMPPLWGRRTGFSSRSRKDNQKTIIEIATTGEFGNLLFFLLNMLLVYRFPGMLKKLHNAFFDRARILRAELFEYGKDFYAFFLMFFVIICIRNSLAMLSDLITDVFRRKSWAQARRTVYAYATDAWKDIGHLLTVLFRWNTYRTVILAVLWGILAPIDTFHTVISSKLFSVPAWMGFSLVPFVIAYRIGPDHRGESGYTIEIAVAAYVFVLVGALCISFVRLLPKTVNPPATHFVSLTWTNMNAVIRELFDFFQLCALLFSLQALPLPWAGTLHTIGDGLLMSWMPYEVKLGVALAFFGLWYIVASVVPLVEEVMDGKFHREGSISHRESWQLGLSLLSSTLYVTVVHSFLVPFNCIALQTVLSEDPSVSCWQGDHRGQAAFGLFLLMWYTGTAVTFQLSKTHHNAAHTNNAVVYSAGCLALQTLGKLVLVCVAKVFPYNRSAVAIVFLIGGLFLALVTLAYERISKLQASNSPVLLVWRITSYLAVAWLGLALLVAMHDETAQEYTATIVWLAGWAVIALGGLVASWRVWQLSDAERLCKTVHDTLLTLEAELRAQGKMHSDWNSHRAVWLACVRTAHDAVAPPVVLNISDQPAWIPRPPPERRAAAQATAPRLAIVLDNGTVRNHENHRARASPPPALPADNNASLGDVEFDAPPPFSVIDAPARPAPMQPPAASADESESPAIEVDERLLEEYLRTQSWTCRCDIEQRATTAMCMNCNESSPLEQLRRTRAARSRNNPTTEAAAMAILNGAPTYVETEREIARDAGSGLMLFKLYIASLQNVLRVSERGLVAEIRKMKAKNLMQLTFQVFRIYREKCEGVFDIDVSLPSRRVRNFSPYKPNSPIEEPLNNPYEEWVLSHALLTLERFIRFDAFSVAYLRNRHTWTRDVLAAPRNELLDLVERMREGLRGTYIPPPVALVSDTRSPTLEPDVAVDSLPPYVGPSNDPVIAARRAQTESDRALAVIEDLAGPDVARLCAALLPLKSVVTFRHEEASGNFAFTLADDVKATIKGPVDPAGFAAAKGAVFFFSDQIQGRLSNRAMTLSTGAVTAGKGPIAIAISTLSAQPLGDPTHYNVNGKSVRIAKLHATLGTLTFEGPGYQPGAASTAAGRPASVPAVVMGGDAQSGAKP